MEHSPNGYSSNEVSGDEGVLKFDKAAKDVESVIRIDSISELPYEYNLSKTGLDSLGLGSFGVINASSAKLILENNEYSPQKRLMLWHSMCSREYLDVFSSLGVSDTTCLIHGESLIVYICCIAHKEGHNLLDFSNGPQTLQFTYRVDVFLEGFFKSGGNYKLVFFEAFNKVFDPRFSPSEEDDSFFDGYLYYRQLLLVHLKQRKVEHLVFDNWLEDASFLEYLRENEPTCLLLEDGSSFVYIFDTVYELLDVPAKGKVNGENLEKYSEYLSSQNKVDRYCNAVYTLISQSLSNSLSVTYFFELTRHSQDIKSFVSFSSNTNVPVSLHNQCCKIILEQYQMNSPKEKTDQDLVVKLYGELSELSDEELNLRDLLVCNYLKEYSKSADPNGGEEVQGQNQLFLFTFKCLMIHNHLLNTVSVRERCTEKVDVTNWSFYMEMVTATLDFMTCCSNPVFNSLYKLEEEEANQMKKLDTEVKDVFDGNLFSTIVYLLCENAEKNADKVEEEFLNLDQNVVKKFDKIYRHFTGDVKSSFFPIELSSLDYKYPKEEEVEKVPGDLPNHTNHSEDEAEPLNYNHLEEVRKKYLFVNNSFINLYYKFDKRDLPWMKAKPVDELVMINKYQWRDPSTVSERMECIDFHLNFDIKEKQQELTQFPSRRSVQKHSSFSFLLAKYMGSSNLHHPIVIKLEHHWLHVKYQSLLEYSKRLTSAAVQSCATKESNKHNKAVKVVNKKQKEGKGTGKEKLSKVEMLRMKNTELQENKKLESDTNTMNRLESKLYQLFNNDKSFTDMYNNILEHTDGPNRAVDLLTDFKWIKTILSTKNVQMNYINKMIQQLYNCFRSYRLRIVKNSPSAFRKLMSIVLRLIFVYYNHYHQIMTKEVVLFIYTFLYQLNFQNFASNLVDNYNEYVSGQEKEGEERSKKGEKEKKGGKKGVKGAKEEKKEEGDNKNFINAKEIEKVKKENELWDFAIFEESEYNYMLCYMGDLFERTLGSTNDPRVLFRPDAWQKMLLDIVDAKESALVVAPTSTGKTYICYYAMEQVLRLDDNGMVIYVSPNTALALQVTYEITARFSSKYYTNPNLALSSTFLEKFHDPKWNSSQIVVTVPTILEKLLISMRTSESNFTSRLEYIIFDEVHCIADLDLGTFMERCIHLIPCPFLALSATIGNASQFHDWLKKITSYNNAHLGVEEYKFNNNKVHFIQFDERFSDLKLEIYTSGNNRVNEGTEKKEKEKNRLQPYNPVCCVTYNNLLLNGFPKDMYLTPYDCYILMQSLLLTLEDKEETHSELEDKNGNTNGYEDKSGLQGKSEVREAFEYLEPKSYFKGCTLITKRQYRYYLETIKVEIGRQVQLKNIEQRTYEEILKKINVLSAGSGASELDNKYKLYPLLEPKYLLGQLSKNRERKNEPGEKEERKVTVEDEADYIHEDGDTLEYLDDTAFYEMLKRLQSSKRLPCLVFILDRNKMDHVLINVTKLLMKLQWEKFFGTPERTLATKLANKARMDKYQMLLKQYESEKKIRMSATKEQRELEGITNNIELEMPTEPVDVSQEYDPEFYFYNRKTYVNYTDEIEKFINVAANSISNRKNANIFIEALKRGLGIHHEGLPHKFTMLTETLLRLGYLNVIISSKSLAFGINVPCKSVLFCGDNYELTPLMYKQMSGRCGRRGFDLSGHVIFWSIPRKRIKQLLLTKLPTMSTNATNINLSIMLTILSSFYTLIIKSNTQQGMSNMAFLNKKTEDYLDIREDLITNSRKMLVEPKMLAQRLSSILNNTLNMYTSKSKGVKEEEQKTKILLLVRVMVEVLVNCGLVDENGLIRGCYELALLTRDIQPANILLSNLVQTSTLTKLLEVESKQNEGKKETEQFDVSMNLLELLSIMIYRKKEMSNTLNIRRIVSTKVRNGTNMANVKETYEAETENVAQVAYPDTFPLLPYNEKLQKYIDYYNQLVLSTTNKYINDNKGIKDGKDEVKEEDEGHLNNISKKEKFLEKYESRNIYKNREEKNKYIEVGGVSKKVETCHELEMITREYEVTKDIVPTLEGTFCTIIQLDNKYNEVKKFKTSFDNSYMCDYFTHGRFSVLRKANGLGQYAWTYLKKFIVFLQHFKYAIKTYTAHLNTDDILFKNVRHLLDKMEPMFNKI